MAVDLGYDESGDGDDKLLVSVQVGVAEPAKRAWRPGWTRLTATERNLKGWQLAGEVL